MSIPLYGFLQGDTVGLMILADEAETVQALGRKLQDAASLRVAATKHAQVVYNDNKIDPALGRLPDPWPAAYQHCSFNWVVKVK
jgi:hypothetical protein